MFSGIVIDSSRIQLSNVLYGIVVISSGRVTEVRLLQFEKTLLPKYVNPLGIFISVSALQSENA